MLRRGMINLVSMRKSKNNFDSSDVLTGQVNFGTTKGTFLYFFFRRIHAAQLNQGCWAQRGYLFNHFGTDRGMHRQLWLTATACVVSVYCTCVSAHMCAFCQCSCVSVSAVPGCLQLSLSVCFVLNLYFLFSDSYEIKRRLKAWHGRWYFGFFRELWHVEDTQD